MYLTYEDYKTLGGTLSETAFNDYEFLAETQVDYYTFNRLKNESELTYPDRLTRCMYELIKLIESKSNLLNPSVSAETGGVASAIASQSNDGVSISYNVVSANTIVDMSKNEICTTIMRCLDGVKNSLGQKLLYRGVYPGE